MRTPNKPVIEQGVRDRLAKWLVTTKNSYKLLQSLGVGKRAVRTLCFSGVPSLRTALAIDCATNGECNVYSWVDTEWMEQRSNTDTEEQANGLFTLFPRAITTEERKRLRLHMVQRLGAPDRNVLAIVAKLGYPEISKQARKEQVHKRLRLPVHVEDDASEQELQRAFDRRDRLRIRVNAFIKGKRKDL